MGAGHYDGYAQDEREARERAREARQAEDGDAADLYEQLVTLSTPGWERFQWDLAKLLAERGRKVAELEKMLDDTVQLLSRTVKSLERVVAVTHPREHHGC